MKSCIDFLVFLDDIFGQGRSVFGQNMLEVLCGNCLGQHPLESEGM